MFNKISLCFIIIVIIGCVSHPKYNIKSSTPAYIEIDGVIKCDSTPCKITPPHYVRGFGGCADGTSMQSIITAFPIDKSKGFVQQKFIRATCNDDETLYFDMDVTGGIQTIPHAK